MSRVIAQAPLYGVLGRDHYGQRGIEQTLEVSTKRAAAFRTYAAEQEVGDTYVVVSEIGKRGNNTAFRVQVVNNNKYGVDEPEARRALRAIDSFK